MAEKILPRYLSWTKLCPHKDRWHRPAAKLDTLALLCSCAYPALFEQKLASVFGRASNAYCVLSPHHCEMWMVVASIWRKSACVGYRWSRADDSDADASSSRSAGKLSERVAASEGVSESCSASLHRSACICGRWPAPSPSPVTARNQVITKITHDTGVATVFSLPFSVVPQHPRKSSCRTANYTWGHA